MNLDHLGALVRVRFATANGLAELVAELLDVSPRFVAVGDELTGLYAELPRSELLDVELV